MKKADAIEQLCKLLDLSDEAISIAEGWSVLPDPLKDHIRLLMSEYIARQHPLLREMYSGATRSDQERFNRMIEAAQDKLRGVPPQAEQ